MLRLILYLLFLVPVFSFSQGNSVLKKKAVVLIDQLKKSGDIPLAANDTLIDLNFDGYIDILVEYYGASGTGLKNRIKVLLYHPSLKKFKECYQLSNLANPTFNFSKNSCWLLCGKWRRLCGKAEMEESITVRYVGVY